MALITYRNVPVALANRDRVHFAESIEALEPDHPLRRFMTAMCLYARDIHHGHLPGPYTQPRAELYARWLLIPDADFLPSRHEPDHVLAERFNVPLDQIAGKREDVTSIRT